MAVFDPGAGFNAFAAGAQIGGNIRQRKTEAKLAPMVAAGDYQGAMNYAASRGDMASMDYIRPMQEKAAAEAYNKELGALLASGDRKGAIANAFAAGKLDQGIGLYNYDRALRADEITDYKSGIDYLASNAERLKAIPDMAARAQEAMRIIQESPFGQDQNVVAAVQRAAADGKITNEEIDAFSAQLLSAGERLSQQNWQADFNRQGDWRAEDVQYRDDRAAAADQQWGAGYGLQRDQFNEGVRQFDLTYGLNRDKLAADAAGEGAGVAPGLAGLPPGVQSAIVTKELGGLESAAENRGRSDEIVNLAEEWLRIADGYGAQGGGVFADIGQALSQKTAPLKGLTERMVMLQKKPGTGPMTDDDARRAQRATLNINQGPEANRQVLAVYQAQAQNDRDYEAWLREAQATFGYGAANQANQLWMQYSRANPVYDKETGQPLQRMPITQWLQSQGGSSAQGAGGLENASDDDLFNILGGR